MKKLFKLFLAFTLFSSCANSQQQNSKNEIVTITFDNEVNGYSIDVIWKPNSVHYGFTKGPAIITFSNKKDSINFSLSNNNFSISNNRLPFIYNTDSSEILSLKQEHINLVYDENNLEEEGFFGTTNEPFFFQDLDFDNIKELLLVEVGNAQRYYSSFKAYKLESGGLQTEMSGITHNEPYKSLDELSTIDYKNKRIIIYNSGGICANSSEIYNYKTSKDKDYSWFELETLFEEEYDNNRDKCYELKYKIVNRSRQLISRKELK